MSCKRVVPFSIQVFITINNGVEEEMDGNWDMNGKLVLIVKSLEMKEEEEEVIQMESRERVLENF